jgi:hypothetical protein
VLYVSTCPFWFYAILNVGGKNSLTSTGFSIRYEPIQGLKYRDFIGLEIKRKVNRV